MRTLRLASPLMRGEDVRGSQRILNRAGYLPAAGVDGVYGPVTANAAKRAKHRLGYAAGDVNGAMGDELRAYLSGKRKPTPAMRVRAKARASAEKRAAKQRSVGARAADLMVTWYAAGWREDPSGSNYVPQLSAFAHRLGLSAYYTRMGFAWCALAANVAALACGSKHAAAGLKRGAYNALYTPELRAIAERGSFYARAISKASIVKGTYLLLDFDGGDVDHIEIALGRPGEDVLAAGKRWSPGSSRRIVTVGGNTSYEGHAGSQSAGGCVAVRIRDVSEIRTAYTIT